MFFRPRVLKFLALFAAAMVLWGQSSMAQDATVQEDASDGQSGDAVVTKATADNEDALPAIRVVSFSIIDTETQKPIKGFEKITKDDTISIGKLPTDRINVRANVSGKPGSIRFVVPEEKVNRVESKSPYSLAGDVFGRFLRWTAKPGTYTLTAVPYTSRSGRGERGDYLQVKLKLTE